MLIDHLTRLDKNSRNAVYVAMLIIAGIAMYGWIVSPHVKYLQAVQKYRPAKNAVRTPREKLKRRNLLRQIGLR